MIPLQNHEQFEEIYSADSKLKTPVLIYFTASWCGACKKVSWKEFENVNIPAYICDVDENPYTGGFCGVRSIPNFLLVGPGKTVSGPLQTSDGAKVVEWINQNFKSK